MKQSVNKYKLINFCNLCVLVAYQHISRHIVYNFILIKNSNVAVPLFGRVNCGVTLSERFATGNGFVIGQAGKI